MNNYVSFDIGGTKIKHGLLSESGVVISKNSYQTPYQSREYLIQSIAKTVKAYRQSFTVSGVAVSFPGFVNIKTGYVERAGALELLNQVNLQQVLEKELTLSVEIENDANCAALAEKFLGNARDCQDFICLTIGTGIGGGIFIGGQLVHGHQWRAGEFGMMNMVSIDEGYQNLHEVSSTKALIDGFKTSKNIPREQVVEGQMVFEAANHDPQVQELVDRWLNYLSHGIFNLACTLNPEKILIGGGMSHKENLLSMIESSLAKIPPWSDFKIPLERCYFKNDAGLVGALYHFLNMKKT